MKTLIPRIFLSGAVAVALAGVNAPQNSSAQTEPAPAAASAAPVAPPPDIAPGSPLAQVVRLTQAGVDQGIIMTYVANSTGTFNLDSDRIIYLTDLGAPNTLITAMMQRDQQLQQQFTATTAAQPTQPAQPTPAPQTAPPSTPETATQPEAQPAPVTVDYFNTTLSPYGSWVVVAGYGRCWRPTAAVYDSTWQPYCDRGQWVYTDCGWYWNSSYAWGATFHYGRWFRDASVGWCWYPDTVWAPSWVTWRYSDNYCGWAPLPPRTSYQAGVGIVYNGGGVSVSFGFGLAANCFTFVPTRNFCDPHPHNYRVAPAQVTQVFNQTKIINNITVNGSGHNQIIVNNGIAVQNVAAATRTPIHPVSVHEIDRSFAHGGNGQPFNNHATSVSGANRTVFNGNSSSPAYPSVATQNHFPQTAMNQNPQPERNWTAPQTAQPEHNNAGTTVPQHQMPPVNYHSPTPAAPVQIPQANYNQQAASVRWQDSVPTGTPRSYARYSDARQNYSEPAAVSSPQQNAPASAPASSQSQQGGGHNGNQNWPGH